MFGKIYVKTVYMASDWLPAISSSEAMLDFFLTNMDFDMEYFLYEGHLSHLVYWWFNAKEMELQCISNGVTSL